MGRTPEILGLLLSTQLYEAGRVRASPSGNARNKAQPPVSEHADRSVTLSRRGGDPAACWNPFPSTNAIKLSATDVLAPPTMKNAAKCDTSCDLQNPVNHQNFERILRFRDIPGSMLVGVSVNSTRLPPLAIAVASQGSWRTVRVPGRPGPSAPKRLEARSGYTRPLDARARPAPPRERVVDGCCYDSLPTQASARVSVSPSARASVPRGWMDG